MCNLFDDVSGIGDIRKDIEYIPKEIITLDDNNDNKIEIPYNDNNNKTLFDPLSQDDETFSIKKRYNGEVYQVSGRPHYELFIYHNMNKHQVYVTFKNGVKLPVEYNKHYRKLPKGIYILEHYITKYVPHANRDELLQYYSEGNIDHYDNYRDYEEGNPNSFYNIEDVLEKAIIYNNKNVTLKARLVTYIDEKTMIDNKSIHNKDTDLFFTINDATLRYPTNNSIENINSDDIDMKIVAYGSGEFTGKTIYFKLFNMVYSKKIVYDKNRSGIYIYIKNGDKIYNKHIPFKDNDKYNVYFSYEDAYTHGDLDKYLKVIKLKDGMREKILNSKLTTSRYKHELEIMDKNIELEEIKIDSARVKLKMEKVKHDMVVEKSKVESFGNTVKMVEYGIKTIGMIGKLF